MYTPKNSTAVFDRSIVDLELVAEHLELEPEDLTEPPLDGDGLNALGRNLTFLISAAKRRADIVMCNPFVELDFETMEEGDDLPIPEDVERGVLEYVKHAYEAAPLGVTEDKVGDLGRKFARYATRTNEFTVVEGTYWMVYRRPIGG